MESTIKRAWFDKENIFVEMRDGRIVGNPLSWWPRLDNATDDQRNHYELSVDGIHWPDVDEDLSAEGFLTYTPEKARQSFAEYREKYERVTQG